MKISDIQNIMNQTNSNILEMFESTTEEFRDRKIQEGFKLSERNKLQKLVKTPKFWEGYNLNLTKYSVEFKEDVIPKNPKATKEENLKLFFNLLEKYSLK